MPPPRFVGLFPVSKIIKHVSVHLRLPRFLRMHPTFHVGKLKPVKESPMVPAATPPPLPRMVDGGPVYPVKKLLAVLNRGRGRQHLVDWKGYGPEHRSWVLSSFIIRASSGIRPSSGTSTTSALRLLVHQEPSLEGGVESCPRGGANWLSYVYVVL